MIELPSLYVIIQNDVINFTEITFTFSPKSGTNLFFKYGCKNYNKFYILLEFQL